VVVVDNASPAGERDLVRREFPHVRLVERSHNGGFGSAANAGIACSTGRWILVLNPDAWPLDDSLERLTEFAEHHPEVGAIGPLLFGPDGRPQRSTIRPPLSPPALALWAAFPRVLSGAYDIWRKVTPASRRRSIRSTEFLQGAAMLVRSDAFHAVGGFDESFFMYGEDADLCARLRDAGWSVEICPDARFVHVGGGSSTAFPAALEVELLRSWLRLIAKHQGSTEAERARRWLLRALRLRTLGGRVGGQRGLAFWLASGRAGCPFGFIV
jgi:GT2 family glycosyltransferase